VVLAGSLEAITVAKDLVCLFGDKFFPLLIKVPSVCHPALIEAASWLIRQPDLEATSTLQLQLDLASKALILLSRSSYQIKLAACTFLAVLSSNTTKQMPESIIVFSYLVVAVILRFKLSLY
jgi:hypothetical protein